MAYPKLLALAEKLVEKTEIGKINWEESAKEGVYQAVVGKHTVQISTQQGREEPDLLDLRFVLLDEEGKEFDSFLDTDILPLLSQGQRAGFYKKMMAMYEKARRTALGTEQAIDSILKALDDIIPF